MPLLKEVFQILGASKMRINRLSELQVQEEDSFYIPLGYGTVRLNGDIFRFGPYDLLSLGERGQLDFRSDYGKLYLVSFLP